MTKREITVRAIEAYLTADKKAHRKPKAEQILAAIERLGYMKLPLDSATLEGISNLANIGDSQSE